MNFYHGTNTEIATKIVSTPNFIDRTKGGGELGMGFYTTDNLSIAIVWAKGKFGDDDGKVVEFEIDKNKYSKLNLYMIKKRDALKIKWKQILKQKKRFTYLFHKDVVFGPFATIDICIQYKFESQNAENFINNSPKKII